MPLAALEDDFDNIAAGWQSKGLVAADLLAWGKWRQVNVYILAGNRLCAKYADEHRRSVACLLWGGHFHLYQCPKFAAHMRERKPAKMLCGQKRKREVV